MAVFSFSGEIINELDGHFMEIEFDYEVYQDPDMTREDVVQMGEELAGFMYDQELLNYILDNLSIVLRLENVEMEDD